MVEGASYSVSEKKSEEILFNIQHRNPENYVAISGDRPTGPLHLGHYFGVLRNRIMLQELNVKLFILIADYQFYTDRKLVDINAIGYNIVEILLDYLSIGINPNEKVVIFNHSAIPELNQLIMPFLSLVSVPELMRNPTVKEESKFLKEISGAMLTYPVHQAADILFCKANVVPVGKDQLAHLELCRKIVRKFNNYYGKTFSYPHGLLSETPLILGMDGVNKMSKSKNNAIYIKSTEDETYQLIMSAKTDSLKNIAYDPHNRPEIANLLTICALCSSTTPEDIACIVGSKGSGYLKKITVEAINSFFLPIRKKRIQLQKHMEYVLNVLKNGNLQAREVAIRTLEEVSNKMGLRKVYEKP